MRDLDDRLPLPQGNVDDASHLNATPMKVVVLESNWTQAVGQLRSLLKQAKAQGTTLTPAGSRHTMGGQTLQAQGIALDMTPFKQMQLDRDRRTLTVQSGATWADVIPFLNDQGFSVAVMQSNNDFSIGGTLSANAHGWQHNYSPFASTVESLRLMLADGRIIQCSRQVNQELFSLVLGGYGLFGIVLDVDLAVVPNELYRAEQEIMSSADYAERYRQRVPGFSSTGQSGLGPKPGSALGHAVDDTSSREASLAETPAPELNRDPASVGLAYGRLSITPDHFLQEAILTTYHRLPLESPAANLPSSSPSHSPATPTTHSPTTSPIHPEPYSLDETYPLGLARVVFRGSIGSDYGKNLRWQLEKLQGEAVGDLQSRNQILNRSSSFLRIGDRRTLRFCMNTLSRPTTSKPSSNNVGESCLVMTSSYSTLPCAMSILTPIVFCAIAIAK
ncbi:MAG: FAD-binding oxidoreductase [Synechococcales cyanobacterium RM1_1_8]|nr:FAD-binding oxidoreductase [Synechococcales cyanobacterium RM1_1_8]